MQRLYVSLIMSFCFIVIAACGTSSSTTTSSTSTDGTGTTTSTSSAADYATFGQNFNNAMPSGLKAGAAASSSISAYAKYLSGDCATDYTNCPYLTASGGGDSQAGEILMRLWALDYNDECTAAYLADGTCFSCTDCSSGSEGSDYIKPTMISDPSSCATTETSSGRYVNFGIDPCFFDAAIANISNIASCGTAQGGSVNISSAVPWYSSWSIPQTVNFSSYVSTSNGGMWWTINNGTSGTDQYFISLDSNWLYGGIKSTSEDIFLFFGTGSPAYFATEAASNGYTAGVNLAAYYGTLSATPAQFEVIQVRVQSPHLYIQRLKSNGSYVWHQYWSGDDFPDAASDLATVKNSPTENRCVVVGSSIPESKYVPLTDCVTSFGATDVTDLNSDSNYYLKLIDGETAGSIDFSTPLTSDTTDKCLAADS